MNKQTHDKIHIFKKPFFILLVLDFIEWIWMGISMISTFKLLAGYGKLMLIVAGVIVAVIVLIMLFEILGKIFLIRSTSTTFSWTSHRKGYVATAKLLLLFNFTAVILNVLSLGGEGATLMNQLNLYLSIIASFVEMIVVFFYLCTVKRILKDKKEDNQ